MAGTAFSFEEGLGTAPGSASAPPPPAQPPPGTFSFEEALGKPTATPQWQSQAPRALTTGEGGDGVSATNLSPEDLARFQAGQSPSAAPTPPPAQSPPQAPTQASASGGPRGLVANIGAGTSAAVAGTLGMPVDLATGAINLGVRGVNALAGTHIPTIENPVGGSDWWKGAEGLIGADPRNVPVENGVEQLGRAAGTGAASMLLPWGIARSLPVMAGIPGAVQQAMGSGTAAGQAATGAVAGATGQVAENAVPEPYKPLANFAGQMLGGAGVIGSVAATRALLDGGKNAISNYVAPLTQAGRDRLAGQRIAAAATDPAAVRDTLGNLPTDGGQLVPGSQPTTFQATGDAGLGTLERAAAKENPQMFLDRAAEQNAARVDALQDLAPADASPEAVGQAFRGLLDRIDAEHQARVQTAQVGVRGSVEALGGGQPAATADQQASALQGFGQQMRGSLAEQDAVAKAQVSKLWDAIDPDGSLTVNMQPVRDTAQALLRERPANAAPLTGEPQQVLLRSVLQPQVQSFAELSALRGRITDAMRAARVDPNQAQGYRALTRLLGSVNDAMTAKVAGQAAQDAAAVKASTMTPGNTILERLRQTYETERAPFQPGAVPGATDRTGTDPVGRGNAGSAVSGQTRAISGGDRAEGKAGPGLRPSPVNSGLPGASGAARQNPVAAPTPQPPSLLSFLVQHGGLRDESGELRAMGMVNGQRYVPPGLIRSGGLSHDYAREAAEEAGYLKPGSDVTAFRNAMAEEASGRRVYPISDQAQADAVRGMDRMTAREQAAYDRARSDVMRAKEDWGLRLSSGEIEHATRLTMGGMHPEEAIIHAARASQEAALGGDASRRAFSPQPGLPPGAVQPEMTMSSGGGGQRQATIDQAAVDRYAVARAAHADRKATFGNAPGVGQVLAPGPQAGEFRLPDSRVPAAIFSGRPGAAERVQAYLHAGGDVAALRDYAAYDLRRTAQAEDGTLKLPAHERWMKAHAEALSALPELREQFGTAAHAQQSLDRVQAEHVTARKAFEASAAAHFLGDWDPVSAVGRILRSDRALPQMQELSRLTEQDPAARAGLRRAVVDLILRDLRGNAAAGQTGTEFLKSDAFQTFAKRTPAALRTVFSDEQVKTIRAVAEDLQRANKSVHGTKLPGGSNTAQDLAAGEKHGHGGHGGHGQSVLSQVVIAEAVGEAAEHLGGLVGHALGGEHLGMVGEVAGKAVGIGTLVLNAMRQAGMKKVDDLVAQAMLDPALAKLLLAKAPAATAQHAMGKLIQQKLLSLGATSSVQSQNRQPEPVMRPDYGQLATPRNAPRVSDFVRQ